MRSATVETGRPARCSHTSPPTLEARNVSVKTSLFSWTSRFTWRNRPSRRQHARDLALGAGVRLHPFFPTLSPGEPLVGSSFAVYLSNEEMELMLLVLDQGTRTTVGKQIRVTEHGNLVGGLVVAQRMLSVTTSSASAVGDPLIGGADNTVGAHGADAGGTVLFMRPAALVRVSAVSQMSSTRTTSCLPRRRR